MEFELTFLTITSTIFKLFIVMFTGYLLYYFKVIDAVFTDKLSLVLVRLFFPALIFSKIVNRFSFNEYRYWWVLPLCAIAFSFTGMFFGWLISKTIKGFKPDRELMACCGFQNCGYLPMNLIMFAFAGAISDRLLIYTFLYTMGFNILVWSLVPLFLARKLRTSFNHKILFNPPVIAIVASLLWVMFFGKGTVPDLLDAPLTQLGNASFPIAMFTLGAYLCRYRAHVPPEKMPVIASILTKLFLFPLIIMLILKFIPCGEDYKFFLFLQSIMPTAVSLVVIGSYTGADNKLISTNIFYTHLMAIFSIPLWLLLFNL